MLPRSLSRAAGAAGIVGRAAVPPLCRSFAGSATAAPPTIEFVGLDHSGTINDEAVEGPVLGFKAGLAEGFGVITNSAMWHRNMGLAKDKQLKLELIDDTKSPVRAAFIETVGREPTQADVDRAFELFNERSDVLLVEPGADGGACRDLLPNSLAAHDMLRDRGIKIGGTTGFPTRQSELLLAEAAKQGFTHDVWVHADELPGLLGVRPSPHNYWLNLLRADVRFPWSAAFVDDTEKGCAASVHSGCFTFGVYDSSTHNGAETAAEWRAAPAAEREAAMDSTADRLVAAGCHVVMPNLGSLERALAFVADSGVRPNDLTQGIRIGLDGAEETFARAEVRTYFE